MESLLGSEAVCLEVCEALTLRRVSRQGYLPGSPVGVNTGMEFAHRKSGGEGEEMDIIDIELGRHSHEILPEAQRSSPYERAAS